MSIFHIFAINLSTERYLQAVVNDYEFICDQCEQRSFFICNDCESKMAMFAITSNYVCEFLHVIVGKFTVLQTLIDFDGLT